MKKFLLAVVVASIMLSGAMAAAAPAWTLVREVDVIADKNVTPIDHSFFDQAAPGRVAMSNMKNLWGAGAGMIFYVETDNGSDWLKLAFSGGIAEISLQNRKLPIMTERMSAISASNPLVMTVQDGQLTVSVSGKSRTVSGVSAFKGSLTTQSIECTLKAYQWIDQ